MKLSTAIRKGAKLRPQAFVSPLNDTDGSCAMAAALEAVGGSFEEARRLYMEVEVEEIFPIAAIPVDQCPDNADCDGQGYREVQGMVFHLNDEHRWTRERIAKWVSQVEKANT